jgi:hypothetical protein
LLICQHFSLPGPLPVLREVNDLIFLKNCGKNPRSLCLNPQGFEKCGEEKLEEGGDRMKKGWIIGVMAVLFLLSGSVFAAEPIKLGMSTWLGYAPLYLAKE